ncbi:MAG TPA: hypothetical protein VIO57_04160 [Chloroflexota bacterium]
MPPAFARPLPCPLPEPFGRRSTLPLERAGGEAGVGVGGDAAALRLIASSACW